MSLCECDGEERGGHCQYDVVGRTDAFIKVAVVLDVSGLRLEDIEAVSIQFGQWETKRHQVISDVW